mmetsp:Transcript_23125/g.43756  ORF Transcript_23125/g.43756 Transcript_23125/m.43756 type:complete len:190 (-) Transcript_23125:1606-2175(-)
MNDSVKQAHAFQCISEQKILLPHNNSQEAVPTYTPVRIDIPSQYQKMESSNTENDNDDSFKWTAITVIQSIAIFVLAGIAEIVGGWLVWAAVKGVHDTNTNTMVKKPWYYALLGALTLAAYGFIPCLQPSAASDGFGRIYAAYGGFFIVMSFLFAWWMEGESAKPDVGDMVGGGISLVGVFVIMFWPGR